MGSVTQAIEYYTTARETLKAHSHVSRCVSSCPSFFFSALCIAFCLVCFSIFRYIYSLAVIAQESNEIMNSLRLRLNSSIQGEPNTISQADFIESVSYLLRLGTPVSSLVERYVAYHR